jgi:hypothetical protein
MMSETGVLPGTTAESNKEPAANLPALRGLPNTTFKKPRHADVAHIASGRLVYEKEPACASGPFAYPSRR